MKMIDTHLKSSKTVKMPKNSLRLLEIVWNSLKTTEMH